MIKYYFIGNAISGSLESCFDECPLNDICGSPNTICDKLKDTAIAEY